MPPVTVYLESLFFFFYIYLQKHGRGYCPAPVYALAGWWVCQPKKRAKHCLAVLDPCLWFAATGYLRPLIPLGGGRLVWKHSCKQHAASLPTTQLSSSFASHSGALSLDGAGPPLFSALTPEEDLTGLSLNCNALHNHSSISVFPNSAHSGKARFGHRE